MTEQLLHMTAGSVISPARVVLGGRFGEEPRELSFERLDRFAAGGGRYVETAHSYADGLSESTIGEWLRANPGMLQVIDKVGHPTAQGRSTLSANRMRQQVEESLARLGVEAIDVLLLHRDDTLRPVPAIVEALVGLHESGYVRRVGLSNWDARRLSAAIEELKGAGCVPVVSYHLSLAVPTRDLWPGSMHADQDLLRITRGAEVPLLAWAAHARGYFAGRTECAAGWETDPFDDPRNGSRRARCQQLAQDRGLEPEVVALAWTLHQPQVWPIVGPRTTRELDLSLRAAAVSLSDEDLDFLVNGEPRG